MTETRFRTLFVAGPFLSASIVPSLLFWLLLGQWGSNIVWGSYFGIGWCLAAFATGDIVRDDISAAIGLLWGWAALVPLHLASGVLWRRLDAPRRRRALMLLGWSFVPVLPAGLILELDRLGLHLPDYTAHVAFSY
jgi:hypothetical protein